MSLTSAIQWAGCGVACVVLSSSWGGGQGQDWLFPWGAPLSWPLSVFAAPGALAVALPGPWAAPATDFPAVWPGTHKSLLSELCTGCRGLREDPAVLGLPDKGALLGGVGGSRDPTPGDSHSLGAHGALGTGGQGGEAKGPGIWGAGRLGLEGTLAAAWPSFSHRSRLVA